MQGVPVRLAFLLQKSTTVFQTKIAEYLQKILDGVLNVAEKYGFSYGADNLKVWELLQSEEGRTSINLSVNSALHYNQIT